MGKTAAPGPDIAIGECEVLRQDSSKEELLILCPDKESFKEHLALIPSGVDCVCVAPGHCLAWNGRQHPLADPGQDTPGNAFEMGPGTSYCIAPN